jgi:pimeloyl-[acyl-carrier protein] methyl ester esterase
MSDAVLVHGWGMPSTVFDELADALATRHRVHAPDLPGYGARPATEPYALEGVASALATCAPARCDLVGWSLGAQIALAWAHARPRQIGRLVLIAATPSFLRRAAWPAGVEETTLDEFAQAVDEDRARGLARFAALQAHGDKHARSVVERLRMRLRERPLPPLAVLQAGLELLRATDLREALPAISAPSLVIHGDRDSVTPLAAGERLADALPYARLAIVAGAAHAPFVSRPAAVARLVLDHLDD